MSNFLLQEHKAGKSALDAARDFARIHGGMGSEIVLYLERR